MLLHGHYTLSQTATTKQLFKSLPTTVLWSVTDPGILLAGGAAPKKGDFDL